MHHRSFWRGCSRADIHTSCYIQLVCPSLARQTRRRPQVAMAGGQLFYFNALESIPIGLAVLLEYLGVVLVVGWLWAVRGQRPGGLTVAGVVAAIAGLAFVADLARTSQLSPAGITWGLLEAVCLAAYFLLSAAA